MKQTTFKILNGIGSVILLACMLVAASFLVGLLVKAIVVFFNYGYEFI